MLGAITGAAVKIIVISDISLAASLPLATSRTIARDRTIEAAAPIPWINRAASMSSILPANAAAMAPTRNNSIPA
jgi:hypothetical protein